MNRNEQIFVGVICLVAAMGIAYIVVDSIESWRQPTRELWQQVQIGDSEDKVTKTLGKPNRAYDSSYTGSYKIDGFGWKDRPIGNKVLIYLKTDLVLYVWFDQNGKVEEKFVASS